MLTTKEKSPLAANQTGFQNQLAETNNSPTPRKWQRVLRAFLSGRSLNRFEATRELRDWCLHTTVAGLEARGVRIDRQAEIVPGQFGAVHCKRYRLAPESHQRASELLGHARTPTGGSDAPYALPEEARHGAAPAQE